jgi:HEAT repeat protein
MQDYRKYWSAFRIAVVTLQVILPFTAVTVFAASSVRQEQAVNQRLTPRQLEIEKQRLRLSSAETEERREALTRLGSMHHPAASRVAIAGLNDPAPIVRATAAVSVLSLPPEESAASLLPLLGDKDEFVRQQVAYVLGQTRSRAAVAALVEQLADKKDSVRGAAAVALGQIADDAAVIPLAAVLNPQSGLAPTKKSQKGRREQNPFVLRAAAHSLGQIGNRAGMPALLVVLQDEKAEDDVKREAASALGMIGDPSALPALRSVLTARDPYLSEAAHEALRRIELANFELDRSTPKRRSR